MYKDEYKNDNGFTHLSPMKDLSPDRNILAYNPYVNNQPIKPFDDAKELEKIPTIQKRSSSPKPGQNYAPTTIIKYGRIPEPEAVKRIDNVEKIWVQNENINNQQKDKIMNSLRDHFNQVLRSLTDQMNFQLRRRDEDIKRLQKRLKDNEIDLQTKQKQLAKLKQHEFELINQNLNKINNDKVDKISLKNKPIEQLQRNFQYLTGRIRDIDGKIKVIIESYSANAKQAKTLVKMEQKVNLLLEEFVKVETKKIYGLNLRMFEFFSSKDSLLIALQTQVQAGKQSLNSEGCPSKVNMTVYEQKLTSMKRQLEALQKTVQYVNQKQSKSHLEPGRLERVEKQIARLQDKNVNLQSSFSSKWETLEEYERQYKTILSRINKVYGELESRRNQGQPYERAAGHLKTTPKKQVEPPKIKPLKQKKISAPQASNLLYYSTHDSTSDVQHFNDSDDDGCKGKMSEKLLRLIEIIRTNRKAMPLRCVVDETGYLKERDTGAYLFDRNGVLFQLQQDELDDAIKKRIVYI